MPHAHARTIPQNQRTTTPAGRAPTGWRHAWRSWALAPALAVAAMSAAHAAPVTLNLDVSLGPLFVDLVSGQVATSTNPLLFSFTLTFDPTLDVAATASGLTVDHMDFTPASAMQFGYSAAERLLSIGGAAGGPANISLGVTDIVLQILLNDLNTPTLATCADPGFNCSGATGLSWVLPSGLTLAGENVAYLALEGSVTGSLVQAVPEPATLALVGIALLAGSGMGRRRMRAA